MSDDLAPIEIFCSYAQEDESHLEKLHAHLSTLKREGLIATWHDRQIVPGMDRAQAINTHLEHADVILLLVSPDFLASDWAGTRYSPHDYQSQMHRAMQRHEASEALVLPIIVRPCGWTHTPLVQLRCLPRNRKPVTMWDNGDMAWNDIVEGIRTALDEVHHLAPSSPSPLPRIWMIPFARNRFFTGQAAILTHLANTLDSSRVTALSQSQAISGLGGIGKTQIAIEYAYRQQEKYQAIFWVRADTREALVSGFVALAEVLKLQEKDEENQTIIVQSVVRWLTAHTGWLLILDQADDPSLIQPFLPSVYTGHILLTTRAQAVGSIADPLIVDALSQNEGALLLLRRARLVGPNNTLKEALPAEVTLARKISEELGGLPLALDQAGAYIEETGCGLAGYQQVYQQRRMELLKRRGSLSNDYPETVATTWTLSFEKVKQQSLTAADLLYCCALLHPEAIPEELFAHGASQLGSRLQHATHDSLAFDDALRVLLAYSLIHRDPTTTTLSIHRLVQAVLIDLMPAKTKNLWKGRVVRALKEAFPEVEFKEWTRCERLLSHVLICATWIEHEPIPIPEASHLLCKAGIYLRDRAQYGDAEALLARGLSICEQNLGDEHLDTARCLNDLARLYWQQGKYELAEPLFQRALSIRERQLGSEHPDTATNLDNLAVLYWQQGKYELAEPLFQRALSIRERQSGVEHPDTAKSLNNLGILYWQQGKYKLAEPLLQRALSIRERQSGAEHPDTAAGLNNLALLHQRQGKCEQAQALYQRALLIWESRLGAEHPDTAHALDGLAEVYQYQGKYEQAEALYQRALLIWESRLGVEHPHTAYALHGLAVVHQHQGKYEQAEAFYQRALAIREQRLGPTHPLTQETREAHAGFLLLVERDVEATVPDTNHEPLAEDR
jgi:tetratricopeptide (TPR) repeat protein